MRIHGKGLIDRNVPISFKFDKVNFTGFAGDTLASALMANDVRLLGRSFKYHRPRGVLTAGSEEPNALVTIGSDANREPNTRATVQELYNGLEAHSQNHWPSLAWDFRALFDLATPFLGAGFYYKTFMWPRGIWERIYEPLIRRAAGLGALSGEADRDCYERAWAHCDLLVIGSGPAGLMATLAAGRAGLDVILADEDSKLGGRLLAETHEIDQQPCQIWAERTVEELRNLPNVQLMSRTTVTGIYDHGTFAALERVGQHRPPHRSLPRETFWRLVARHAILAAGAMERPIVFANNDRPGILLASSIRDYLNRWGVCPGESIAVFTNNNDAYRTVRDLTAAGVNVAAVIDSRSDAPDIDGIEVIQGAEVYDTRGRKGLKGIRLRSSGRMHSISVDALAVSGGWNPTVNLACHLGSSPVWREDIAAFVPLRDAVPNLVFAGSCMGSMSTQSCLRDGAQAGLYVAQEHGKSDVPVEIPDAEDDPYRQTSLWYVTGKGKTRAWLDFQNDVTVKDVELSVAENYRSVEHLKRYTTQGMATDQGKLSNVVTLAVLSELTNRTIPETGTTTFRPPYTPVSLAAIGADAQGKDFAPERFTPAHRVAVERGAPMIEAGLWYRPSYFPEANEHTMQQSIDREVRYVRNAVGICDVSTLGKIDIQGRDSVKLLDFVYTNTFSSLKVGSVRYGLMLREDGHVMDDGTSARLGDSHYLMTTTTAAAGFVLAHLEFVNQCLHPEWDVTMISVTEQWAQYGIAGPLSRTILNELLDDSIENDRWPFMSCGEVAISGIKGRLFRISFSGERAYELAVPARYGESVFRILVAKAEERGGGVYGMEALNVLRMEKGFITHAEIDGRATAYDIGLARMASKTKDYIGKRMASRPGLTHANRHRLVGLRPVDAGALLSAGAHLFPKGVVPVRKNDQGHISSAAVSPTLGTAIGLGFLKNGPERYGEEIDAVDHLRGVTTRCLVTHPVFFDPEGTRARD